MTNIVDKTVDFAVSPTVNPTVSPADLDDLIEVDFVIKELDQERKWKDDVRKDDREFVRLYTLENPIEVREARLRYVRASIRELTEQRIIFQNRINEIFTVGSEDEMNILLPSVQQTSADIAKRIRHLTAEKNALCGRGGDITPEMIALARDYPIKDIVDVDSNHRAVCVNPEHDDHSPSMFTRGNWAHCFSCNWHGDAIDVFMLSHNVGFKEAVKSMTNTPL